MKLAQSSSPALSTAKTAAAGYASLWSPHFSVLHTDYSVPSGIGHLLLLCKCSFCMRHSCKPEVPGTEMLLTDTDVN